MDRECRPRDQSKIESLYSSDDIYYGFQTLYPQLPAWTIRLHMRGAQSDFPIAVDTFSMAENGGVTKMLAVAKNLHQESKHGMSFDYDHASNAGISSIDDDKLLLFFLRLRAGCMGDIRSGQDISAAQAVKVNIESQLFTMIQKKFPKWVSKLSFNCSGFTPEEIESQIFVIAAETFFKIDLDLQEVNAFYGYIYNATFYTLIGLKRAKKWNNEIPLADLQSDSEEEIDPDTLLAILGGQSIEGMDHGIENSTEDLTADESALVQFSISFFVQNRRRPTEADIQDHFGLSENKVRRLRRSLRHKLRAGAPVAMTDASDAQKPEIDITPSPTEPFVHNDANAARRRRNDRIEKVLRQISLQELETSILKLITGHDGRILSPRKDFVLMALNEGRENGGSYTWEAVKAACKTILENQARIKESLACEGEQVILEKFESSRPTLQRLSRLY